MKIRSGFVSNSSSSSFVIALPKNYKITDEEMVEIRDLMEEYDGYFDYYSELAESEGNTELIDEREKVQKMLKTGNFEEEVEEVEPVNDDVKNADIKKGFEFLTTAGYFWSDEVYDPVEYAAKAIVEILNEKILVGSTETSSDAGQVINILADSFIKSKGMAIVKESLTNEN